MTNKQRQNLLAYLGYYVGTIDGIWGSGSREAAKSFQRDRGLTVDGYGGQQTDRALKYAVGNDLTKPVEDSTDAPVETALTGTFWDGIKYWTREEFRCQCGGKYCNGFPAEPSETLVKLLDDIREYFGRRGHRSSGLRCRTWNAIQGGVDSSRHMTGKAMDFRIEGYSADQVLAYVNGHKSTRYAYDIDGTYVHVDVD